VRCLPAAAASLIADRRISIRCDLKPLKAAGAAAVFLAVASAVGSTTFLYEQVAVLARRINEAAGSSSAASVARADRRLPAGTALSILVESYPAGETSEAAVRQLTAWLEASGYRVFYERVDRGADGRQWRVLAGAYKEHEYETASWDAARLKVAAPVLEARVITTASARRSK
jgi:hypothetical protein